MLFFLVTRDGRHVLDKYLASWGGHFFDRIQVRTYESLLDRRSPGPGTYVFADLERLPEAGRRAAGRVWERLEADPARHRLLNHPERSLRRYDLLRRLAEHGVNDFHVFRADAFDGSARFPVFLRRENDHAGPRTPLLWDPREVAGVLSSLRARGTDLSEWLVIEYEDCADDAGFYRKYSSFFVGGVLIPRHVFFSRHWMQKLADLRGGPWAKEELAHVVEDPHAEQLRPVFELAGIQYGRIDYSIGKRGTQVWEINTNPIILDPFDQRDPERMRVHELFAERWEERVLELCAQRPGAPASGISAARLVDRAHVAGERLKETPPGRWLRSLKLRALARSLAIGPI